MTTESKKNLEVEDYDALLRSAKTGLQLLPPEEIVLPNTATRQKLEKMCVGFYTVLASDVLLLNKAALCRMRMLQTMYAFWPEKQRKKVAMWVKKQVLQNSFNYTVATSGSTLGRKLKKFPKKLEVSLPTPVNCASYDGIKYMISTKSPD